MKQIFSPTDKNNIHLSSENACEWVVGVDDMTKLSYEETCKELQKMQILENGPIPPLPSHAPRYDDEELSGTQHQEKSLMVGDPNT